MSKYIRAGLDQHLYENQTFIQIDSSLQPLQSVHLKIGSQGERKLCNTVPLSEQVFEVKQSQLEAVKWTELGPKIKFTQPLSLEIDS
mmetsp:Transcript_4248/g.7203  ORF Transcript_4248/g.7203 Transcript_4248/m.7203 type:complete len:87 (+) Transcript_4248:44-304(+)